MILDVYELSERLSISVSWIYAMVSMKKIPYYKIGRVVRFDRDEIERWLKEKRVEAKN